MTWNTKAMKLFTFSFIYLWIFWVRKFKNQFKGGAVRIQLGMEEVGRYFIQIGTLWKRYKSEKILYIFKEDLAFGSPKYKVCTWKYCGYAVRSVFSKFTVPGSQAIAKFRRNLRFKGASLQFLLPFGLIEILINRSIQQWA